MDYFHVFYSKELMFAFNIILSLSCFLHSEKIFLLSAGAQDQLNIPQPPRTPAIGTHNDH